MKLDNKFFQQQWVVAITAEFGAVGQLAVIHLLNSIFESPEGYWRRWGTMERQAFTAQVPGLTVEVLDAIVARLAEYGIVNRNRLNGSGVLTSAWLQREFVKQCGVGRARKLQWLDYADLSLHDLLELGIVPAEEVGRSDEPDSEPGVPIALSLNHPDRNTSWRRVRVRSSSPGVIVYRPVREALRSDGGVSAPLFRR